jgi:hypothetical protein
MHLLKSRQKILLNNHKPTASAEPIKMFVNLQPTSDITVKKLLFKTTDENALSRM